LRDIVTVFKTLALFPTISCRGILSFDYKPF